jgi:hypothetical protein
MVEEKSMREVAFRAEGGELVLSVAGYEFPDITTGWDGNWLNVDAWLTLRGGGIDRSELRFAATVLTSEFSELLGSLTSLLKRKRGHAELDHVEEELLLDIHHEEDYFVIDGDVGVPLGPPGQIKFRLPTDLESLQSSRDQLASLVEAFPVRGNLTDE